MKRSLFAAAPGRPSDPRRRRRPAFAAPLRRLLLVLALLGPAAAGADDVREFVVTLDVTAGRSLAVTVYEPPSPCDGCALIVFSHGANAAPSRYRRLLRAWAAAGFLVAAPLHVDSELHPRRDDFDRDQVRTTRVEDVALIAGGGALPALLRQRGIEIGAEVVAAGHSYGALIAQVAAGARFQGDQQRPASFAAPGNLAAVVALSPPGPLEGFVTAEDWTGVAAPMLVVTGTTDILPGFVDDWRAHLVSFESAAAAPAYALVYDNQDHYFNGAFGRPRERLDDRTARALASLNRNVLSFLSQVLAGEPPGVDAWLALDDDLADARVSDYTRETVFKGGKQ